MFLRYRPVGLVALLAQAVRNSPSGNSPSDRIVSGSPDLNPIDPRPYPGEKVEYTAEALTHTCRGP